MKREDLLKLKKELANLSVEEQKQRNLYLRGLANGELQGPPVGYSSIDKQWLKFYNEEDFDLTIPKMSIYDFMNENTKGFDDFTAFEYFGFKVTYREFKEKVEEVKKALVAKGVKQGDVVSVCLPNTPEVGYIFYALNDLGAVANMLDPRTNASTLVESVEDAKSDLVITLDMVTDAFVGCKAKNIVTVSSINSLPKFLQSIVKVMDKSMRVKLPKDDRLIDYNDFVKDGKKIKEVPKAPYIENAPAVIAYTGGTTGQPKGVIMTNEAFNAMIVENKAVHYNADPQDMALGQAPPWTFYGLSNSFNAYLCLGVGIKLIPKFGPDDLGKLVLKNRPNHIETVPSALVGLMNEKKIKGKDLSYIKTVIVGADKLSEKLQKEFNDFLVEHNCYIKVSPGYGMTEVCAAAAYALKDTNTSGTVGIPLLFEDIAVFNPEDPSEEWENGKTGEIAIKGPKGMLSYFGKFKDKTSDMIKVHEDGSVWIHTGDLGHMDQDGKIYIDGRIKRMFVKNGFKIFPGEVEYHILTHPDVEQAAVIAVEDDTLGYKEKAYMVLSSDCTKSEQEVRREVSELLKTKLYDYEIPDEIEVIDRMPLTQMNKIDFKALEKMAKGPAKKL